MSLPESENDQELEAMLTETFGPPPCDDIDAWRQRYPSAQAWLNPQRISALSQRRKRMQRIIMLAATTAAAICVWLGLSHFETSGTGASAFAQTAEQIQRAKTITWRSTVYIDVTDKDGRIQWVKSSVSREAFKAPGLYRRDDLNDKGQVGFVCVTDNVRLKELQLNRGTKQATLREMAMPDGDPRGPFLLENQRGDFKWVGKKEIAGREVNIFRTTNKDDRRKFRGEIPKGGWTQDYWVDAKTKHLVRLQWPGSDIYEPEKDPLRDRQQGKSNGMTYSGVGWILDDIVYDAELNDTFFALEPPKDYAIKINRRPQVTENDMVGHLGVMAEYYNNTFPDRYDAAASECDKELHGRTVPAWFPPAEELDAFEGNRDKDRTAAQNKIIEAHQHYISAGLNLGPFRHFIRDHTVEGTWQYLGKGVKLGDKTAIVCWYKLKDAKDPNTYRVVYGDLSVKDVAAKDLPLPVEP